MSALTINGIAASLIIDFINANTEYSTLSFLNEAEREYFLNCEEAHRAEFGDWEIPSEVEEEADRASNFGEGLGTHHASCSLNTIAETVSWAGHIVMTGHHPFDYEGWMTWIARNGSRIDRELSRMHTVEFVLRYATLALRNAMPRIEAEIAQRLAEEEEVRREEEAMGLR